MNIFDKIAMFRVPANFINFVAVFLLAALCILQPWSNDNGVIDSFQRDDAFSARLVRESLVFFEAQNHETLGGFMRAFEAKVHIATVQLIDGDGRVRTDYPYISNYSLQYEIGKMLVRFGLSASTAFIMLGCFALLLMALVVASLCVFARQRFGPFAAWLMLLCFAASPMFIARAANPYWLQAIMFLPFIWSLFAYPYFLRQQKIWLFYGVLLATVTLKCLSGYEYINAIGLGVWFALLLHLPQWRWAEVWRMTLAASAAVFAGFALAAFLHISKAAAFFGTWQQGVQAFMVPLLYSSFDNSTGIRDTTIDAAAIWHAYKDTFLYKNFHITALLWLIGIFGFWRGRQHMHGIKNFWKNFWHSLTPTTQKLWLLQPWAYLASCSWLLLAVKHSLHHAHINWILAYLFYLPLTVLAVAGLWQKATMHK